MDYSDSKGSITRVGEKEASKDEIVVPGDVLGLISNFEPGTGCCTRGGKIYSLFVGKVSISSNSSKNEDKPTISVHSSKSIHKNVPVIGSVVLCKVTNINERQAKVLILHINGVAVQEPFHGILRREDIRAMEKDSINVFQSFRPRDIVRARVIAFGEAHMYLVSTAENELGLVWAECECGHVMHPVNWCEMQCTKGDKEKRKVAKVVRAINI